MTWSRLGGREGGREGGICQTSCGGAINGRSCGCLSSLSFESLVADARARKRAKYHDPGRAAGYKMELITLEVGSRGMLPLGKLHRRNSLLSTS